MQHSQVFPVAQWVELGCHMQQCVASQETTQAAEFPAQSPNRRTTWLAGETELLEQN